MVGLTDLLKELSRKSKEYFQIYKTISAHCPQCDGQLAIKFASNPKHQRKLSIIIACTNNCDKQKWNTDAKTGFTHWWLDGSRDREGYMRIVESLPPEERNTIKELERSLQELNK